MDHFKERSTRDYFQKKLYSLEGLIERESRCIYEEPAFCHAACPLGLDAKKMIALVEKDAFSEARAMLEHITPFPRLLAYGCEAPCKEACRMNEVGEGIDIPALERAAMNHGSPKTGKGMLKFKKKQKAAVFGSDLFSLSLAAELARKSYPTFYYVHQADAVSLVRDCAPFLSEKDLAEEASKLETMDIHIIYSSKLTKELFESEKKNFDIFAAARSFLTATFPEDTPDSRTLLSPVSKLLSSLNSDPGVLEAVFDARRAAVSADRISQGLDPGSSRGEEGSRESKLYTDMSEAIASKRIPEPREGYGREAAIEEASRCIQCKCEECIKHCVFLQETGKYPRKLTREIYNNVDIIMGDHLMNKTINSCSLCGQCTVTCPNGYDMAEICRDARENMVSTTKMSLAYHEFALLDMLFSNGDAFLCKPQVGYEECRYVFFPGCQAGAIAPEAVFKAYMDLAGRLEGGVGLMNACCGAIAKWAGRTAIYEECEELLKNELKKLGNPQIIAACPTCKKTLEEMTGSEVRGIWDILNENGLPKGASQYDRPLIMHDSCSARGDSDMQTAIRKLTDSLGCTLKEVPYNGDMTECCGYGGLVSYVNKELASKMAKSCTKDEDIPFISYCMACRDRFAREGRESMHVLELVYAAPAGNPPDISEKRKNRLNLKRRLLKEIWNEEVIEVNPEYKIVIPEDVAKILDERMILEEDVYAVIEEYHAGGSAVYDEISGMLTSSLRRGNVTFWLQFTEDEADAYTICGAYSHRMKVRTRFEV
ncbi:MAG: heterodisulfide reductase-related iron-sulfur binding cluster [Bacillota bacterium]|nr:heterodisulfide reductase-related iron-sulfur binding cluster [Bacillota bacterium]